MSHYLITGGTGLIGQALIHALEPAAENIIVWSRDRKRAMHILGDSVQVVESLTEIDSNTPIDYMINLAGEPIADTRWSPHQKDRLWSSRVELTKELIAWISDLTVPPKLLVSGSAVGWYGDGGDKVLTELGQAKNEYTHQLCDAWEKAAEEVKRFDVRCCIVRTGLVLSPEGGFLQKLLLPFKLGLGAQLGSGEQYMSWVHIEDVVRAIIFLLDSDKSANGPQEGVYNLVSPNPITNKTFTKTLATQLERSAFLFVPSWVLKILLGEMSCLLLTGQRVVPEHFQASGFNFRFQSLDNALINVLHKDN